MYPIEHSDWASYTEQSKHGSKFAQHRSQTTRLYQCINKDNVDRALMMKGLPYRVTLQQIQDFFKDHATVPSDQIFIEEFDGKRSGSALVVFASEEAAQSAKDSLQKSDLEGRYIELFDKNDEFMQKVCRLLV